MIMFESGLKDFKIWLAPKKSPNAKCKFLGIEFQKHLMILRALKKCQKIKILIPVDVFSHDLNDIHRYNYNVFVFFWSRKVIIIIINLRF